MKEKVTDLANYLRSNFFQIIALAFFMSPLFWWACSTLNGAKIETLNEQISVLRDKNDLLQQKLEGYKTLALEDTKQKNWSAIQSQP